MGAEQGTVRSEVIVIGGGQAGLSAGYHLARRGVPFLVLDERERLGDNWRSRWASLRLYSPALADGLPGHPFPGRRTAYPTGAQMGDYLEAYAREAHLPVRSGVRVERVRPRDDGGAGFVIEAGEQRFEADQVVVATGAFHQPKVPTFASELDPAIRQLHSSEYRTPDQLQPGPVLVVGASHSGADIALEAALHGHETILSGRIHGQLPVPLESRRAKVVFPVLLLLARHVATIRTPIGRRMRPEVRKGGGPLLRIRRQELDAAGVERTESRTEGIRDGKPVLADGRILDVANVVWCTGFRQDFSWIDAPVTGPDGWPMERRGVADALPGLYFVGLPFQYAFASMLVGGAGRDAAWVVDRLVERSRAMRATTQRTSTATVRPTG
ncbi:MAG TPA: FAD-dependent oxidoreductase [Candidatus Saccharimonadales bacterium]|nr:FAD-dependent oxidoreductase [Candidatus Saccharimonadales bacterium]